MKASEQLELTRLITVLIERAKALGYHDARGNVARYEKLYSDLYQHVMDILEYVESLLTQK